MIHPPPSPLNWGELFQTQPRIQDGGRISRLIATTALAHLQIRRGSHSPAKAVDDTDAVRLQHGPLRALHGLLAAPARIGAALASTGGPRKKMRPSATPDVSW
ncbi:hypothetical protein NDU88_005058 [Pleurodeles waltl]|uniref:Uncharacterized protein n=1 Tax=Pleurodeles waltl TaxID=8319 RepID=A0AAV7QH88_PLEWA|nr:hypothetical protein NDU88_005058 [Pleurodeles waltl]